jgi:DNA-binding NarL/FixJ family response regulator
LIRREHPDVIVLERLFSQGKGLSSIKSVLESSPASEIVVFTNSVSALTARLALRAGAGAYVAKFDPLQDFLSAIRAVREKNRFVSRSVFKNSERPDSSFDFGDQPLLSEREIEIAKLLANGASSKEIAARLGISTHTIKTHRVNIMHKLKVTSLAELILFGIQEKWVKP